MGAIMVDGFPLYFILALSKKEYQINNLRE
jgi:hypothetical protein